jgi:chemotaxis methyl-accepting protein methylase
MSSSSSNDLDIEVARLLRTLLEPQLGYVLDVWPSSLHRVLGELSKARGATPIDFLSRLIVHPDALAIDALVSAATVPYTRFFRQTEHFERLATELSRISTRRKPVRIWSAGCATGEEPWSIAILADRLGVEIDLLATDISVDALSFARAGVYSRIVNNGSHSRFAMPSAWSAPASMRKRVRFERASITDPKRARSGGPYDFVFCRNVLIYFPKDRAAAIAAELAATLASDGALVVAPVEALIVIPSGMQHGEPLGWLEQANVRYGHTSMSPPSCSPPSTTPREQMLERAARVLGTADHETTEQLLHDLLRSHPDYAEAWFLLGEALLRRGERSQARSAFMRAATCATPGPHGVTLANAARRRAHASSEDPTINE